MRSLWQYRGFVFSSVRNEFIGRFARSWLGGFWSILQPLLQVSILALVLSNVLAAKLPGLQNQGAYVMYLLAGTLGWSLFQETLSRCLMIFVQQGGILKKIDFPKLTLPLIVVLTTLCNHLLLFLSVLVIFMAYGYAPGLTLIWLLPLSLCAALLGLGLGVTLGVFNVFLRDLEQIVPILLQITYWLTPIVYPPNALPENLRPLLALNPLEGLVGAYQSLMVYDRLPDPGSLLPVTLLALGSLGLGSLLLHRAGPELVDAL